MPRIRIQVIRFEFLLAGNYSTDLILQDKEVGGNVCVDGVRLVIAQLRRDVTTLIYCIVAYRICFFTCIFNNKWKTNLDKY